MTTDYLSTPNLNAMITHLGFRNRNGKTDLVIGFKVFGFNDNTRLRFYYDCGDGIPRTQVVDLWEPTLRNIQGFRQEGQLGTEPFKFPDKWEPCDDPYLCDGYYDNLSEEEEGVYLAFCSLDYVMDNRITLVAVMEDE